MRSVFALALLLPSVLALIPQVVRINEPSIPIHFAVKFNATGSANIVEADRARARLFAKKTLEKATIFTGSVFDKDTTIGVPVTDSAVSYIASVGVGNPPTQYNLIVDTGSSNTWVGASQAYNPTSTSSKTSDSVQVSYGSGSFSGDEFTDQVTLASGLVIKSQSIGVATTNTGFNGVDGILGIGPAGLTVGTLSPGSSTSIPTVTDSLFSQGSISSNLLGISFEPTTSAPKVNGQITFGGTDSNKFTGDITFVPITSTPPASNFWGLDQSIKYGNTSILPTTAGILDTGTTLVLIATDAFLLYKQQTGATPDSTTGLLTVSESQFSKLESLFFNVGGTTFELTANAQVWPRALNDLIGGTPGSIYLIVADLGNNSGEGLDFINGQSFLERFYSVYDTDNKQVGLATTPFTTASTN
ncbi:acid protease [Hysterangium stoloniferum]|nr:acid protease [Hysterangium stoloniferum]